MGGKMRQQYFNRTGQQVITASLISILYCWKNKLISYQKLNLLFPDLTFEHIMIKFYLSLSNGHFTDMTLNTSYRDLMAPRLVCNQLLFC